MAGWCIFLTAVVFLIRMAWAEPSRATVTLREAILPAGIFAASLLAMSWAGGNLAAARLCGTRARIFLVAGLAGFLVHNLVTYTLITPATSTVFWIAAAAAAAPAVRPGELPGARGLSIAVAAAIAAGTIAAGAWLWRPVRARSSYLRSANFAYARGRLSSAVADMEAAIDTDKLDAIPASYLSRIFMSGAKHAELAMRDTYAAEAVRFAELAYQRSPRPLYALLLAQALDLRVESRPRALEMAATAVRLNPTDTEYRQQYAEMLYGAGRLDAAAEQVLQMRHIHDTRPPRSNLRLSEEKLESLAELEERIQAARKSASASAPPATSRPEGKP
jgi:tetratricopeptide (TPR) repeat protein